MSVRTVLAIDQGTSGTKALVVCPDRGVLASGEASVRPRYGAGGLVEQDPRELLESVVLAGRRALERAGEPVAAVGLANQGETVLAWDRSTGRPLTDAIVWQDRRAQEVCDRLAGHAPRLAELTGLPLDAYFAAPKMAWLRGHLTTGGVVTTSDSWLIHQLTGAFVTDASTASRTMLLGLDDATWSEEAVEIFGLRGEDLPDVVDVAGNHGTTRAFGPELPLTGLLVDQQAALLAERCLHPGDAKCTYGTGAFLLANTGPDALRPRGGLASCVAWRLDGDATYCLDGQVYTVASAVRWLTELGVLTGPQDLDRLGGAVPDTAGVTFVPAFAGLAAPWWRGDVRASVSGLGLDSTRGHLVRALCEGIAAQVAELAAAVAQELGGPVATLRADGGLTRSTLLMQTQADLLQRPVEVYPSPDATALGVAVAAGIGLTPGRTVADGVPRWEPAAVYEPAIGPGEAAERLERHRRAVRTLIEETNPEGPEGRVR